MLVGLGGNNGSSVVAGVLANKLCVPPSRSPDQSRLFWQETLTNAQAVHRRPMLPVLRASLCVSIAHGLTCMSALGKAHQGTLGPHAYPRWHQDCVGIEGVRCWAASLCWAASRCGSHSVSEELKQDERSVDAERCTCRGITWMTKDGLRKPNYWGSITQAATCRVGNYKGEEVHAPFSSLLPMVHPNDLVLGGWDISNLNLADAMERAKVRTAMHVMVQPVLDRCFWRHVVEVHDVC